MAPVDPAISDTVLPQSLFEHILRDVLDGVGAIVSWQQVERTADGWRITVIDSAHRVLTTTVPDGPPTTIRAALTRWIDPTTEPL